MLNKFQLQRWVLYSRDLKSLINTHMLVCPLLKEFTVFFRLYDAPDHKMHLGFRGGKQEKKFWSKKMWSCPGLLWPYSTIPPNHEPGKLHSDYKMHPHFPPKFGEKGASYSLKNTVDYLERESDTQDINAIFLHITFWGSVLLKVVFFSVILSF